MDLPIHISDTCRRVNDASRKFIFLFNDSNFGFYDEQNVWWKSITHFIEAKKFEGTQYEHEIRNCKTSQQVKRKTKERVFTKRVNDVLEKNIHYGSKKNGYLMKDNWSESYERLLDIALHKKFYQTPRLCKKLVGTYPQEITSFDDNKTASVLMKIRSDLMSEKYKVS